MYEYEVSDAQRSAAERASAEFVEYLRALVTERRRAPGDDLISSLIAEVDSDGARLTEDELITTGTLLLNAGHEASVNVVGNGVSALLTHPDQLADLRSDEALVPSAVEELIRYDSPLHLFERTGGRRRRRRERPEDRGAPRRGESRPCRVRRAGPLRCPQGPEPTHRIRRRDTFLRGCSAGARGVAGIASNTARAVPAARPLRSTTASPGVRHPRCALVAGDDLGR